MEGFLVVAVATVSSVSRGASGPGDEVKRQKATSSRPLGSTQLLEFSETDDRLCLTE